MSLNLRVSSAASNVAIFLSACASIAAFSAGVKILSCFCRGKRRFSFPARSEPRSLCESLHPSCRRSNPVRVAPRIEGRLLRAASRLVRLSLACSIFSFATASAACCARFAASSARFFASSDIPPPPPVDGGGVPASLSALFNFSCSSSA